MKSCQPDSGGKQLWSQQGHAACDPDGALSYCPDCLPQMVHMASVPQVAKTPVLAEATSDSLAHCVSDNLDLTSDFSVFQ